MKIGSAISKVTTPLAGLVKADCYDPVTKDLRPKSPCAKARRRLDEAQNMQQFASAIFDRFWSKGNKDMDDKEKKPIEYLLSVAVEAMTVQEALNKLAEGDVLSINPRAQIQMGGGNRFILPAKPPQTGQVINKGSKPK